MSALITNKNKPKLSMVIGIVRITSIGFTIKRNREITTATMIAETKPSTVTPDKILARITTATAVSKTLRIDFIVENYRLSELDTS